MTRGNQRELARMKNAKKQGGGKKASETEANKGLSAEARKLRDADIMRQKQQKKEAAAAAAAAEGTSGGATASAGKKKK